MKTLMLSFTTIILASCTNLPKQDTMTSTTVPKKEISTWTVGPKLADCVGVAPMKCLVIKKDSDTKPSFFYSDIQGFQYTEGFEYQIVVEETPIDNPPADGSSIHYRLVKLLGKTAIK